MRRRLTTASLGGLGATALLLFACQGQGAFNAIQGKLGEIAEQQTQILTRIDQLETKLANLPAGGPAAAPGKQAPQGPQPGKPDPAATYKVAVADTDMSKGPADAKITLVEWSDFQ
jgi:protein-disulfide isomerase